MLPARRRVSCRLKLGRQDAAKLQIFVLSANVSIFHIDTEISYRAFELGMAEQYLHGPKVAGCLVDRHPQKSPILIMQV